MTGCDVIAGDADCWGRDMWGTWIGGDVDRQGTRKGGGRAQIWGCGQKMERVQVQAGAGPAAWVRRMGIRRAAVGCAAELAPRRKPAGRPAENR